MKLIIPTLTPVDVFVFCDSPQFYSCVDLAGQHYLAYQYDRQNEKDVWLYSRAKEKTIQSLKAGILPIRQAICGADYGQAFVVEVFHDSFDVHPVTPDEVDYSHLPVPNQRLDLLQGH